MAILAEPTAASAQITYRYTNPARFDSLADDNLTNDDSRNNSIRFNCVERTVRSSNNMPIPAPQPLAILLMVLAVGSGAPIAQRLKA